ncbi:MAG: multidrug ABC transporter ATP-binding protein [Firmicutes bacterium HGW-Firmicutes-14]|nr:MAG: multidrug ABC transporter ATP-binding protein [Firmicutes bacterium HGW-Firmicutes-14]
MVIKTEGLTKWYGNKLGCRDICLSVSEGQVFGFLGQNGAGKSTLVKMLVGLIFPTSGRAEILGRPLGDREVKKRIGFLPETFRYQEWLTGYQLMKFHASLYKMPGSAGRERIEEVLQLVRLKGHEHYKIRTYSKGMQQRLGLAAALLPDPDLLILDEPTSAMDPLGRKEVRDLILKLKSAGKTIFLNSHLLSEVEVVCDHVALIKKGRIIAGGSIGELKAGKIEVEMIIGNYNDVINRSLAEKGYKPWRENERVMVTVDSRDKIPVIAEIVINNGGSLYRLTPLHNSLENLFLELMQEGGENDADHCRDDLQGSA